MKPLRVRTKWVLAFIGLLLVLLILKIILFCTAKPKITVDYVAQYNRLTRPQNFDPDKNAAEEYQKAFETFIKIPGRFGGAFLNYHPTMKYFLSWPTDLNESDQKEIKYWLESNEQAFEYFRKASRKPYYWLKRNATERDFEFFATANNNSIKTIITPETIPISNLVEAMTWNAKLQAAHGEFISALEDILACYRAGRQEYKVPSLIGSQFHGLEIKQMATAAGFEILSRAQMGSAELMTYNNEIENEISGNRYIPDFNAQRLLCYDELQRNFVDNGKGTGRLAFKKIFNYFTVPGKDHNRKVLLSCFIGPTRNEMAKRIEEGITSFESVIITTPWQIHIQDPNYFDKIKSVCREDYFLGWVLPISSRFYHSYHQTNAQEKAILTTLAVLRFKADNNRFPDKLEELIVSGYLKSIPLDPYSDGPLIYKRMDNNFLLYSVGEDFEDNGGLSDYSFMVIPLLYSGRRDHKGQDILFWPVKQYKRREY